MNRDELLDDLSRRLAAYPLGRPLRIAVDGPDAAGKTTLADELAARLVATDRQIVRASIDGFHLPQADRYRRGPLSPLGYFEDSFDHEALVGELLRPLEGAEFPAECRTACFDYRTDRPVRSHPISVARDALLLFDGIFLFRPELADHWDVRVYLHVDPEVSFERGVARDGSTAEERSALAQKYRRRYLPGQRIYRLRVAPDRLAQLLIDNTDPARPLVLADRLEEGRFSKP